MRIALIALLLCVGCEKENSAKAAPKPLSSEDALFTKWREAGLEVSTFDVADGAKYGGGDCKAGQVNGVDAVVCTFETPEAATAAHAKGLEAVGLATGSALVAGSLMLVVVDRRKADPEGRTINQATKIFRGR